MSSKANKPFITLHSRAKQIFFSSVAVGSLVVAPILIYVYFTSEDLGWSYYLNFGFLLSNALILLWIRKTGALYGPVLVFVISAFTLIFSRSILNGGIFAPTSYWIPVIPTMFAIIFEKRIVLAVWGIAATIALALLIADSSWQPGALEVVTESYRGIIFMQTFAALSAVTIWQMYYSARLLKRLEEAQDTNRRIKANIFHAEKAKAFNEMVDTVNAKNQDPLVRARARLLAIQAGNQDPRIDKIVSAVDRIEEVLVKTRSLKDRDLDFVDYSGKQIMLNLSEKQKAKVK